MKPLLAFTCFCRFPGIDGLTEIAGDTMEPVFGHFYSMNWHSGTDFSLAISICKCQYVTHVFRAQFIQPLAQHKVRFCPSICLEPVDSNKAIGKDVETLALILYFGTIVRLTISIDWVFSLFQLGLFRMSRPFLFAKLVPSLP
jgi:hypothetical protein